LNLFIYLFSKSIFISLIIALILDNFVVQKESHTKINKSALSEEDDKNSKKIKWKLLKSLGTQWERELVNKTELPEMNQEMDDIKQKAKIEIGKLKNFNVEK
jgi:hypothetical protein